MPVTVELCVDSIDSAQAAERGGAQRIELSSSLVEGGVTPSAGLISHIRSRVSLRVFVMIRPRPGDFCYSADEFEIMKDEIGTAKRMGVDGIVLGMLTKTGDVDIPRTRHLVEIAQPLSVTFHRAFDMSRDLFAALEQVIETGSNRILTSGGKATAEDGVSRIAALNQRALGRIILVAAGGIRQANVRRIISEGGVAEIHANISSPVLSSMRFRNDNITLGSQRTPEYERLVVLDTEVRSLLLAASIEDRLRRPASTT
jgi:copper homeostasis protein